jgi:hypothetical protein
MQHKKNMGKKFIRLSFCRVLYAYGVENDSSHFEFEKFNCPTRRVTSGMTNEGSKYKPRYLMYMRMKDQVVIKKCF